MTELAIGPLDTVGAGVGRARVGRLCVGGVSSKSISSPVTCDLNTSQVDAGALGEMDGWMASLD